ncbi:MAG TPA: septation protein IspZ [Caulobacteraceae bacterium]
MKNLWHSGKFLALDMASTLIFLGVYLATRSIPISVALGVTFGVGQFAWQIWRKKPIDTMQWMSLFLVVASGTASLITHDPRFVMIKASLIYAIVGIVMLKPGWMNRYLPQVAMEIVPDIALAFGFVWSGLMFLSAALNVYVALHYSFLTWSAFMSMWGTASKATLFAVQFTSMRLIGARRRRSQLVQASAGTPEGAPAVA